MSNKHGHQARKRFGQNFLHDPGVIERIVRSINPKPDDAIVEIGPGLGAITEEILAINPRLQVVELDRDLIPVLRTKFFNYPEFQIHEADALNFDFRELMTDRPLRIVGNLPYNISTPLIFHLLEQSGVGKTCTSCCRKKWSSGWRRYPATTTMAAWASWPSISARCSRCLKWAPAPSARPRRWIPPLSAWCPTKNCHTRRKT